ncbi:hypothetical protein ABZ738_22615 [Micromonospora sp. NPDC047793]|uniref:hypothetical protein n=1 Tax=Micromonospora sp. NPDC047793 TaxID=3154342 RepID=UPI0033C90435
MNKNPFSLPDRSDPWDALDPLSGDSAQVLDQYVAIDNTEEAFLQFERTLPRPDELTRRGQLVVAMGMDGGGKSSLINKCAWRAKAKVEAAEHQAVEIDTRSEATVTDQMDARLAQVAESVAYALHRRGIANFEERDRERLAGEPVWIYSRLQYMVKEKVIVLVRLPRTERIEEIVQYAQLSQPNLVFFAELGGKFAEGAVRPQVEGASHRRPILLEVGPLSRGHGAAFVENRFRLNDLTNTHPVLEPAVAEKMISSRRQSIREFQNFLYLMYEGLRSSSSLPERITWLDVLEVYYQLGRE